MRNRLLLVGAIFAVILVVAIAARAEQIGSIELDSGFMSMTSYSLNVQAFDDPKIEGVTCHVSDVAMGGFGSCSYWRHRRNVQ